jgi:hypothetical protein
VGSWQNLEFHLWVMQDGPGSRGVAGHTDATLCWCRVATLVPSSAHRGSAPPKEASTTKRNMGGAAAFPGNWSAGRV